MLLKLSQHDIRHGLELQRFDDDRGPLAAADARRRQSVFFLAPAKFIQRR